MKLFANSKTIACVHGAGLANATFCQPKTKIIELYPKNWDWYGALCMLPISAANGLDHHIVPIDFIKAGEEQLIQTFLTPETLDTVKKIIIS